MWASPTLLPLDAALTKMVSFREVKPLDDNDKASKAERSRRIIKRYSNRKLYDTRDSRYVTLLQIAGMVRAGEDVQIIDNATKEDKTEVTLALIISEELKSQPRSVPLGTLRDLIHQRGEKLLSQLRDGPIGRLIPGPTGEEEDELGGPPSSRQAAEGTDPASAAGGTPSPRQDAADGTSRVESSKTDASSFEQWRHAIDERIRAILPSFIGFRDLQHKVDQLAKKVSALEEELARKKP